MKNHKRKILTVGEKFQFYFRTTTMIILIFSIKSATFFIIMFLALTFKKYHKTNSGICQQLNSFLFYALGNSTIPQFNIVHISSGII